MSNKAPNVHIAFRETDRCVLIVDDDKDFAESTAEILTSHGYIIRLAHSPAGARQIIANFEARVALIDVQLRQSSGINLISQLKKLRPHLLCVIITAYSAAETAIEALKGGAYDYLCKPFEPQELLHILGRCFDKIQTENERKKLEEQLRHAQKMEAIGTLSNGIAHDFNNLLHSITGFADLLKKRFEEGSKEHRFSENIIIAARRGSDLTKRLLAFSRLSESEKKITDIRNVVKEYLEILRPSTPSTIKIETHISHEPCLVLADASQIYQIMMNICVNAIQAMPDGGTLIIKLQMSNERCEMSRTKEHCKNIIPCVRLVIKDTGKGIEESIQHRIYDPFFTTKSSKERSGLGLSIVHGIIKNHGGNIVFSSAPGKGTTFCICFPVMNKTHVVETSDLQAKLTIESKRVLFVDDEELVVEMTVESLAELGFKVAPFTDSLKALEMFSKTPYQFDIVILDQTMPGLTGLELTKKIKNIRKDIPVLLCTGYDYKVTPEDREKAGVSKLLKKPITTEDLALVIQNTLDNKK